MSSTEISIVLITAMANLGMAAADMVRAPFVMANSAEVGVSERWLLPLAGAKGAGAVGLIVGLLGPEWIGALAAAGLVAFFVGALGVHIRARVFYNLAFPGAFLGLAIASLIVFLDR